MDRIDRVLLAERQLTPGPDFRVRVMERVRREATAPPIPFPWLRFLAGFVGAPLLAVAALVGLQAISPDLFAAIVSLAAGVGDALDPRLPLALTTLIASALLAYWSCSLARTD